jgi:hypothetical protein
VPAVEFPDGYLVGLGCLGPLLAQYLGQYLGYLPLSSNHSIYAGLLVICFASGPVGHLGQLCFHDFDFDFLAAYLF